MKAAFLSGGAFQFSFEKVTFEGNLALVSLAILALFLFWLLIIRKK